MSLKKIVIVDDDKMVRRLLEALLTKEGYEVIIACDGKEGIDRINEVRPDVVILDVKMPRMNGHEVLTALKKDEFLKDIPVIMLSSLGLDKDIEKGLSLRAAHYLVKPVQNDSLLGCIKTVLCDRSPI